MIVWSLFDGSGIMGLPWAEYGHTVYCFNADSANHGEYKIKMQHPKIHYVNLWIDDEFMDKAAGYPLPDIIFAFPDCTMLSGAGAKYERTEEAIANSIQNARRVEGLATLLNIPWMVENPVGKMSTLWRRPNHYFDPYQYGGYMTGEEESYHPKMPPRDGYTKKTCIWAGNGFVMPETRPVEHIGKFWGWAYLGGKSERTKQLRSLTPRGFARAVFLANRGRLIK
ncbi:DNA cytosine methyltransferase [Salmonella enterica]|nr:DNA cytosine methyltransferase [Salmonella enterica]EHO5928693.1 DNA cytosine methyltransferase [Salmonella enterica]